MEKYASIARARKTASRRKPRRRLALNALLCRSLDGAQR
jgi:hypothetical protein